MSYMKKAVICLVGLLVLFLLAGDVSAYIYRTGYESPFVSYHYDQYPRDAFTYINLHEFGDDYDDDDICLWHSYGGARVERFNNCDDWDFQKRVGAAWLDYSSNLRYAQTFGRSSGDAFYYHYGQNENLADSNWRFKEAYNPVMHGVDRDNDYYYKPRYDSDLGRWNWKY